MAEKPYTSKTRYVDLAKYHLELLRELCAAGPGSKDVPGPNAQLLTAADAFHYDCRDLAMQCTLLCAFAVEAEAVVLLEIVAEMAQLVGEHERGAFREQYARKNKPDGTFRTKSWPCIRKAIEHTLAMLDCTFPTFKPSQGNKDELVHLIEQRNIYAHFKPEKSPNGPYWGLVPTGLRDPAQCLHTAQHHWQITEDVYAAYQNFWKTLRAKFGPS